MLKRVLVLISLIFFVSIYSISITASFGINDKVQLEGNLGSVVSGNFTVSNFFNQTKNVEVSFTNLDHLSGSYQIGNNKINFNAPIILNGFETKSIEFKINLTEITNEGFYVGTIKINSGNDSNQSTLILEAIKMDFDKPEINSHSPTGKITSSSIVFTILTNEASVCKYSINPGINFEFMENTMDISDVDAKTHTKNLFSLDEGINNFYVKCKDQEDNISDEYKAGFIVDTPPRAELVLNKEAPLKAGTYQVTLILSEEVVNQPVLQFSFDGLIFRPLPLSGDGRIWSGFLLIDEDLGNKVASFKFSGRDINGNTGTEITRGGVFLVDTIQPKGISKIEAFSEDNGIKLKWRYTGEDADSFMIYRSERPNVGLTDLYEEVNSDEFLDVDIDKGSTYYYKISVKDSADNEGPLSYEVDSTTSPLSNLNSTKKTSLPKDSINEINKELSKANEVLEEVDKIELIKVNLETNYQNVYSDLKLNQLISSGKDKLNQLIIELENLKEQNIDIVTIDKKINRIDLEIDLVKKSIPEKVTIVDEKTISQVNSEERILLIIDELYLELKDKEKLKSEIIENSQDFFVETIGQNVEVSYLDGTTKKFSIVKKSISGKLTENIELIEWIPKEIVSSVNKLDIQTKGSRIIKEDPILSWPFNQEKIIYVINNNFDLDLLKSNLVLPFPKEVGIIKTESSQITGRITGLVSGINNQNFDSVFRIVGIAFIVGLGTYLFIIKKDSRVLKTKKKDITHIQELLLDLNEAVDNKDIEKATNHYTIIRDKMNSSSKEVNKIFKEEILNISQRINSLDLKVEIERIKESIRKGRNTEVKERFERIKSIYQDLEKDYRDKFDYEIEQIGKNCK